MSAINESNDSFRRPDPNVFLDNRESISAQALTVEPPLSDDAGRTGPRSRHGVRYAPSLHDFFNDPSELHCEYNAEVAAGGGCYGFLMTRAIRARQTETSGNKLRGRPISYS
jgi:hypothetical protein